MAEDSNSIASAFEAAIRRANKNLTYYARLGNGQDELYVTDDSGAWINMLVWARIDFPAGVTVQAIRCRHTAVVYDMPVVVGPGPDDRLEVLDINPSQAARYTGDRNASVGLHAWTHGVYGGDPLVVDPRLIQPLAVMPTAPSSLGVRVLAGHYDALGVPTYHAQETLDLTAYVPASDERLIIVCLNPATNAAVAVHGGYFAQENVDAGRLDIPFAGNDIAVVDTGTYIRLAAVRLFAGQTKIEWYDIAADLRWMSNSASGATATAYVPDDITDWIARPPVETVTEALDELADRVRALETQPTADSTLLWLTM